MNAPTSQAEPSEKHHAGCCGGHPSKARTTTPGRSSFLGAVLPVLACAVCPTCLGAWAQALSALGVGFVVTETQHLILLVAAVVITLAVSGRRYARSRRAGPLVLSLAGSTGLVASHVLGEIQVLAWSSIAVLVAASIWQERARPRQTARGHEPEPRGALRGAEVSAGAD
ncbi:MerC domain-containing protein [Polyangium sorediatum]|uniref:MerC domain-containing protein n=1 Tax=Polyangium sorediatum TaxID=889274 RepID=A0ABT6P6C0_9BACT|nr:MerC domain-containing protein [Polyangium sorediatum]MDI1436153.1 MerC domain-containing protein [Polyangium sorediatum]